MEAPHVPSDLAAIDFDIGTAGLRQGCGRGLRAQAVAFTDLVFCVTPRVFRQRNGAGIDDFQNLVSAEINNSEKPLDRLGVEIRAGRVLIARNLHQPLAGLLVLEEVAGGQRKAENILGG